MKKNIIPAIKVFRGKRKTRHQSLYFMLLGVFALLAVGILNGSAQVVTKQLYLSDGLTLDRIDPVTTADGTTASTTILTKNTSIYIDGATGKTANSGGLSPLTISYTTGSSSNRLMVVQIATTGTTTVTTVLYGTTNLTKLIEKTNGATKAELWYLLNPPSGTANLSVNWTGTLEGAVGVSTFSNVDQTVPFGSAVSNSGSSSPSSLVVPSNGGDLIIDVMARSGAAAGGFGPSTGQQQIVNVGTNSIYSGSSYKVATAGSTTMGWTTSTYTWSTVGVAIKGIANHAVFSQSPALCSNLVIPAGHTVTLTCYGTTTTGTFTGSNNAIPATLKYGTSVATATTFFQDLAADYASGVLTWSGTLGSTLTITSGQSIYLDVYDDSPSLQFYLNYDSSTAPSKIALPTSTYINVNNITVYSSAYPGGVAITQQVAGTANYIRATVSDPFGSSDITGLNFLVSGGSSVSATSVSSNSCTTTYEYAWMPATTGTYTLTATAREGTEGTATHQLLSTFKVISSPLVLSKTKLLPVSGPIQLGDNITYQLAITNNGNPVTTLPLQDSFDTSCLSFVSASVQPTSVGSGSLAWANLASTSLASGSTYTLTVTMKVVGNCTPSVNTAKVEGAKDNLNTALPTMTSSANVNINQKPVAVADNFCISGTTMLDVLANDSDGGVTGLTAYPASYTVSISANPSNGSATVSGNQIQFSPTSGTPMAEDQQIMFVYKVTDTSGSLYATATVTVRYSTTDSHPQANSDAAGTTIEKPVIINVLANDVSPEGFQLPAIATPPTYGFVTVNSDKTITYTPSPGFVGTDSFQYQVCDITCSGVSTDCSTALVTVTVDYAIYVCQEGANMLTVPAVNDAISYTWILPAGSVPSGSLTGTVTSGAVVTATTTTNTIGVNWNGVAPGKYSVCASAKNDCGDGPTQCINVVVNKILPVLTPTPVACYNSNTGFVSLTPSGGVSPYSYSWTGPNSFTSSQKDLSSLIDGTYTVTVFDKYGCSAVGSAIVTQPASSVSVSGTVSNTVYPSGNGSITTLVSGGTGPYTYSWSTGETTPSISSLAGGAYQVTVTDANGCSLTKRFLVNQLGGPVLIAYLNKTDVLCYGGTGAVSIDIMGGTGSYSYSWSTGATGTNTVSGLSAGTYSVTITDSGSASTTTTFTVGQPLAALSASASTVNVLCYGSSTGSINLSVSGGTGPYSYLWNTGATTPDISGLSAGTYSVKITDANGCTTNVSQQITQPGALNLLAQVVNINCITGNAGSIDLTVTGGTAPYTYSWNTGSLFQDVTGLSSGNYVVTVTDSNGCTAQKTFVVENECLGIAKAVSYGPVNNGDGTYSVAYTLKVENKGTVRLNSIQVSDDLSATFAGTTSYTVTSKNSSDFTVNAGYDGKTDISLIAGSALGSLAALQAGYIELNVKVTPGNSLGAFANTATATALDSGGNSITDASQSGTTVDNNPGSYNDPTILTFPENPKVGVAKALTSAPVNNGDGTYTLGYTITLSNLGDVALKNVRVTDNLVTAFAGSTYTVSLSTSSGLSKNPAYNGNLVVNLLTGNDGMPIGDIQKIYMTVNVRPTSAGPFNNLAYAAASGIGGSTVSGTSQPTPVSFTENPQIGLAKQLVGTPVNNGDGTYRLTYNFVVKNTGDVPLNHVQVTDNLTNAFSGKTVAVNALSAAGLTVNGAYNGTSDFNLLSGTNTLAVGVSGTISLTVTVTPGNYLGAYGNTATATALGSLGTSTSDTSTNGPDVDPENDGPGNNSLPTPVTFTESPQMGVAKSLVSTVNNQDGTYSASYLISVKNTGNVPLNAVQATDDLATAFAGTPYSVSSVSSSQFAVNGAFNGGTDKNLLAGSDALAVGTSGTISLIVTLTPGTKLGVYSNSVVGNATSPGGSTVSDTSQNGTNVDPDNDGNPGNNNQTTPLTFTENPQIGVAKRIVATPTNNGNGTFTITYEILVKNIGDVPLNSVQVIDNLVDAFAGKTVTVNSLSSAAFTVNNNYDGTNDDHLLTGTNSLAVSGAGTIMLTVTVTPGTFGGPYSNSAVGIAQSPSGTYVMDVSQDGTNVDPNSNGIATDNNDPTLVAFMENPKIGIAKQVISVVDNQNGTNDVTLLLTLENMGNVTLSDLKIYDDIATQFASVNPRNFSASEGSLMASGSWSGTASSNILVSGQTLGATQTGTVFISFRVSPGATATLNNVATAWATGPLGGTTSDTSTDGLNPDGTNNDNNPNEMVPTPVNFKFADLVTVKTLVGNKATPWENDLVGFAIAVTNRGTTDATHVHLTDILPSGMTYSSATTSAGTYSSTTGLWNGLDLANGSTATLTIYGTVNPGQLGNTLTNTTTAALSDQYDPTTNGDDLSESVLIVPSSVDLEITKSASAASVAAGQPLTYTLVVRNNSVSTAPDVSVEDVLAASLTVNSATSTVGTWSAPTWTIGNLSGGSSATLTIVTTVNSAGCGSVSNGATVTGTLADSNLANNSSTVTVTILDDDAPSINCPSALTVGTNSACTYVGSIGTATGSDNCAASVTISNDAPSAFPIGVTTVTWTADDGNGNTSTCTQQVTVIDDDVPIINCPSALTVGTNSACTYVGSIGTATGSDNCAASVTISNDAPTAFLIGVTTVTWTADDVNGNTSTCTQVVTVIDDDAPSINCPSALTVGTNSACTYVGSIGAAMGSDNCAASVTISNDAPSAFPIGVTTVTWTADDVNGNTSTCTQQVTVIDDDAPIINCPSALTVGTNSACTYVGSIGAAMGSDNCAASVTISNDAPSAFPIGVTTVTWTADDGNGNTSTCTQQVTVIDDDVPIINCPSALTVGTNSACTYVGSIGAATGSDNCAASVTISNDAPSAFPIGVTTVTWTADDGNGNTSTLTQQVTVIDDDVPIINCPSALTVGTNSACTYVGSIGTATGSDNCAASVTISNDAPSAFPIGVTTVTWTADDGNGNTSTCTQQVTVNDDDVPIINCPSALTVGTNSACTYVGSIGTATGSDNCAASVTISNDAPSAFPIGVTTVTWTADDGNGNTSTCTQIVKVIGPIDAVADLTASVNGTNGNSNLGNVLDNDMLNCSRAALASVTITMTDRAKSNRSGPVPFVDPVTGIISVPPGTSAGTYEISYRICEKANPNNCDETKVTVPVPAAMIVARDDNFGPVSSFTGDLNAGNILTNDLLNGLPVELSKITISIQSVPVNGVTLNPFTGVVSVAPNTPAGTYHIGYRICEILNPTNCDDALVTVKVSTSPIVANDDNYGPVNGSDGNPNVGNVTSNDWLNGSPVKWSEMTITVLSDPADGVTLDPTTGVVSIAPNTPAGAYQITYRICEILNPSNCDDATVTVTVSAQVSGKVFDDANGNTDGKVNGIGLNIDQQLYVSLIDAQNQIIATMPVAADGTYQFGNVAAGTYVLVLNTNPAGSATPDLPATWVNTGEELFLVLKTKSVRSVTPDLPAALVNASDGLADGKIAITIGADVATANFGIDKVPVDNEINASFSNPGGTGTVVVPELNGSDREDGLIDAGGKFMDATLPTNGKLYYDGVLVTEGEVFSPYDPSKLTLDPNDGSITVTFKYKVIDAAGYFSTATNVNLSFTMKNDVPVAVDNTIADTKGTAVSGSVADNDKLSSDGGNVWSLVRTTPHGKLTFSPNGNFTFMPDVKFDGEDSFTYKLCDLNGDCSEATVTIKVTSAKADLSVTKTVDNKAPKVGETVVFTVTVSNQGPDAATGVKVADKLPSGCIYVSADATHGTYDQQAGVWTIGDMSSAQVEALTVKAKVYSVGDYNNTATISGDQNDPNGNNNTASVQLDEICDLFIPDIFSPNGDGIQDVFKIRCINRYSGVKIEVFNRWGNLVYKKDHYGDTDYWGTTDAWWDGNSNQKGSFGSEKLEPATYFYILYLNDGAEKRNGFIYLNRK